MSVRVATLLDVPRIVEMGSDFLRESEYRSVFLENPSQIQTLATQLIIGEHGMVFLLERADRVVGMIALVAYDHFISGQRVVGEVVYWVEVSARGLGLRLLRAAEKWAKKKGAVLIQMISPSARTDALYMRLGYAPIERTFQRAL
jgi:GNAT superfamily N-acetyltransferase